MYHASSRHSRKVLAALLTLLGLAMAPSAVAQIDVYQGRTLYFTSNQTWVVPDSLIGVTSIHVRAVGGGGGGFGDCAGCGNAGGGGASSVAVLGETMIAYGGGGAYAYSPGAGGGASNCDFAVTGAQGDAQPRSSNAKGGAPFMYGHPTAGGGQSGGYGWGGPAITGSGGGFNLYGGGAGGFCEKTFVVSAGTPVFITVGAAGSGGSWGRNGGPGLVVISY